MNSECCTQVQLVTYSEVCHALKVSRTTLWRRIQNDPLFPKPVFVGRRSPRLSLPEVESYLAQSREANYAQ